MMATYKSEFKATIEWVDQTNRHVVVVYSDPYGHEDLRQSIVFKRSDTVEEVWQAIIDATPHERFHFQNEAYKQKSGDNTLEISKMINTEKTYKLPTFDNEDV
jgi:hypothetical protein